MNYKLVGLAAVIGSAIIAAALYWFGQPLICSCGYIDLWVGTIHSSDNSQHIADWYSLSHFLHGALIALFAKLWFRHLTFSCVFLFSVVTGIAWEIGEHTEFVLESFRSQTIYFGYQGDSIVNAVADYWFMILGFIVAYSVRPAVTIAIFLLFEISSTVLVRESLVLTSIRVLSPIESISAWQDEINPRLQQNLND